MVKNITFNVSMKMVVPVEYDSSGHHIDVLNHIAPFVDEMVYDYKNWRMDTFHRIHGNLSSEPDFSKVQIPFTEEQLENAWHNYREISFIKIV